MEQIDALMKQIRQAQKEQTKAIAAVDAQNKVIRQLTAKVNMLLDAKDAAAAADPASDEPPPLLDSEDDDHGSHFIQI